MSALNIALIGMGGQMLSDHLPAVLNNQNVAITALVDPVASSIEEARAACAELIGTPGYSSIQEALRQQQFDAAIVAVPHHNYPEIVARLCEERIPFLKEKPMARSKAEAEAFMRIPGFAQCCFIATQRRFSGMYSQAWSRLGEIGTPHSFEYIYKLNIANPGDGWRGDRDKAGGGCLLDMGYHTVDHLTWWFGVPESAMGRVSCSADAAQQYTAEDTANFVLAYPGGMHGTVAISRAGGKKREEFSIYGTEGWLTGNKAEITIYDSSNTVIASLTQQSNEMFAGQLRFFVSRVLGNKGFEDIQEDHLRNMEVLSMCYGAATSHTEPHRVNSKLFTV